ncbi:hypothetical protein CF67_04019 [Candidatus Photodesmus blepharus]|uniref:PilZ domain-containing protein n=1 Tax=Candidatus Photodesmus blepharonis TaxID=1179155 RepID=A0A084CML4_9GAMM|nr:hypothetical protein [Candidatus Photodesmus blepharus]KEY91043.1 hypothetical protein CF67_04019 [Candidatus Photodesmus blepharus]
MLEQEFFTVYHKLIANIELMSCKFLLPSITQFESEIPTPFSVINQFSQLDKFNHQARLELQNKNLNHTLELLENQNSKLNLLLTFILSQQDQEQYRHSTLSFGASQFSYVSEDKLKVNTIVRVKLFLEHPPSAIYSYGEIINCKKMEQNWIVTVKYRLLQDCDQDLLIKAALYQQKKLLRQRSSNQEQ